METKISRRAILNIGAAVGGLAVGGSILGASNIMSATIKAAPLPWPWREIKPADVQERAYQSAWAKIGCMYGTIETVIGTLADKYGSPYNTFPVEATIYGSGGIGGLGSVCGTINACGLLFNLFAKNQDATRIWLEQRIYGSPGNSNNKSLLQTVSVSTLNPILCREIIRNQRNHSRGKEAGTETME